jgi:UDP-N-acetylmuramoylalanine--D-glutamate ligase
MKSDSKLQVIVGLGITGVSCARYLKQQGIPFAITDSRQQPPLLAAFRQEFPEALISVGKLDEHLLQQAARIILSPGVALREPAIAAQVKRGIPVVGDIELFTEAVNVPVIGITGTNAKSTVTTLVGLMAEAAGYQVQVGGNLGIPALELLEKNPATNLFVLELSSFQLETTYSLRSAVATVLNVTPDHMDRYDSLEEYQQAKLRIYDGCGLAVCNRDDALTDVTSSQKLTFTLGKPQKNEFGLLTENGLAYLAFEEKKLLPISDIPVKGKHYQANALAALAIGYGFGLPLDVMISVLREFKGLPHRCQFVRTLNDVSWYNDSKGTNVGATQAAIEGLGSDVPGKLILILGGVGKSADFSSLIPAIEKYVRHVVLIGEVANELEALLSDVIPCLRADSMQQAIRESANVALANDAVLLSPACASFDMFKNYEHRGQVFTELVEKL